MKKIKEFIAKHFWLSFLAVIIIIFLFIISTGSGEERTANIRSFGTIAEAAIIIAVIYKIYDYIKKGKAKKVESETKKDQPPS